MGIRTIKIDEASIANALKFGRVETMHVIQPSGGRTQVTNGHVSDLYTSRPGIISLSVNVLKPAYEMPWDANTPHNPGLTLVTHDFDPKKDWVLGVFTDGPPDEGWRPFRVLGRHELGSRHDMADDIRTFMKMSGGDYEFEHFVLPGGGLWKLNSAG